MAEATLGATVARTATGTRAPDAAGAAAPLWARFLAQRDSDSRNRLVEHYYPLVRYLAEKLKARLPLSVDVDDLSSAGAQGLLSAVEGFEPERGVKFETYCTARVRGSMLDELRSEDWAPRQLRHTATKLRTTQATLARELGREPTEEEMAERFGLATEEFRALARSAAAASRVSLEATEETPQGPPVRRADILEDRRAEDPWEGLRREDVFQYVLKDLTPKERLIVVLYYWEDLTMKEIGQIFGVTESRICQLHTRILRALRQRLKHRAGEI
ncbi:MAG: FliA/WhiG family RNA polymerase sigma factor [Planctomycetales bacterium]|nr:FliA/WhiG family RNA polymerase sigma factor [Planctomycetales bacterium]